MDRSNVCGIVQKSYAFETKSVKAQTTLLLHQNKLIAAGETSQKI